MAGIQFHHALEVATQSIFAPNSVRWAAWLLLMLLSAFGPVQASELPMFSLRTGEATVREWDAATGNFRTNLTVLTDAIGTVTTGTDLEFDGHHFYTISPDGLFIRRLDAQGHYLDAIVLTEVSGALQLSRKWAWRNSEGVFP